MGIGRYERGLVQLAVLVFLAPATAILASIFASASFIVYIDLYWLPHAIFIGGLFSLAAVAWIGYQGKRGPYLPLTTFVALGFFIALLLRLFHPIYTTYVTFLTFVFTEILLFASIGGAYGVIDTFATVREKEQRMFQLTWLGLLGGVVGALGGLTSYIGLTLPGLLVIVSFSLLVQLLLVVWISLIRSVKRLQQAEQVPRAANRPLWERLKKRYPIIGVGILISFLVHLIRAQTHILALSTYGPQFLRFGESNLVLLLSALFLLASAVGLIAFFITRYILYTAGAAVINYLYPSVLLASLVFWVVYPVSLTPALIATVIYLGLIPGIHFAVNRYVAVVIHTRFVHDVLLLTNGVFGALGIIAGAGLVLLFLPYLSVANLLYEALLFSIVLCVAGSFMGGMYHRHWLDHMRRRTWEHIDAVTIQTEGFATQEEVFYLLAQDDAFSKELGVLLATQSVQPEPYFDAVTQVIRVADTAEVRRRIRDYLAFFPFDQVQGLFSSPVSIVRARALSALVAKRLPVPIDTLSNLLHDDSSFVRLLACIAAWQYGLESLAQVSWNSLNLPSIPDASLLELLEMIDQGAAPEVVMLLKEMVTFPSMSVRVKAMQTLGYVLGDSGHDDPELLRKGIKAAKNDRAEVRAAAIQLLVAAQSKQAAEEIGHLLFDSDRSVRTAAAAGLASIGQFGLEVAQNALLSGHEQAVMAAINALARIGRVGEGVIHTFLVAQSEHVLRWLSLSHAAHTWSNAGSNAWAPIATALDDYYIRVVRHTTTAVSAMGYPNAAIGIRALATKKPHWQDAATIEAIRRGGPTRIVNPLLKLIFKKRSKAEPTASISEEKGRQLLNELLDSPDRWIADGAMLTFKFLHNEQPDQEKLHQMERLIFLKAISFFNALSLDELVALDQVLIQEEFEADQVVFEEGSSGDRFYLIFDGEVSLRAGKEGRELIRLKKGEPFAEMSLFEEAPRSATAIATTKCTLLSLDKARFRSLMIERPQILFEVAKELSTRLRETNRRLIGDVRFI